MRNFANFVLSGNANERTVYNGKDLDWKGVKTLHNEEYEFKPFSRTNLHSVFVRSKFIIDRIDIGVGKT